MRSLVPADVHEAASGSTDGTEAAVLVVDVAGSTTLSARLRRHGTAGAEALADLLSAVFGPIVEMVHRHGGFVAHFTGDGAIAVFAGSPTRTVPSALAAASAIMSALADIGVVETPAGPHEISVRAIVAGRLPHNAVNADSATRLARLAGA